MLDGHSRLGAYDQQVDHVWIGPPHRFLTLGLLVAEEYFGRLDAQVSCEYRGANLERKRPLEYRDKKHINQCDQEEQYRRDKTERQKCVLGAGASKTRLVELLLGGVGVQPTRQIERFGDGLGDAAGFIAQRSLALRGGEPLAFAHANALALC